MFPRRRGGLIWWLDIAGEDGEGKYVVDILLIFSFGMDLVIKCHVAQSLSSMIIPPSSIYLAREAFRYLAFDGIIVVILERASHAKPGRHCRIL